MFTRSILVLAGFFLAATLATAENLDSATANMSCAGHQLAVQASCLSAGRAYAYRAEIIATPSSGSGASQAAHLEYEFAATAPFHEHTFVGTFSPPLSGSYDFSGSVSLADEGGKVYATLPVSFFPSTLSECRSRPRPCVAGASAAAGFNGFPMPAGDYIWFNANLAANGLPSSGATITLSNSTISFGAAGRQYTLAVPNAQIVLTPEASCSSTTFNTLTSTWVTIAPVNGDDEIFVSGLAFPVPAEGLPGRIGPVTWTGTFGMIGAENASVDWKWGAAAYSNLTQDYNAIAVKAGHQTACGAANRDHAGTPENVNNSNQPWKQFVVPGASGEGQSNRTGSWSDRQSLRPRCGEGSH